MSREVDIIDLEEFCAPFREGDKVRHPRVKQASIDARKRMADRGRHAPHFGNVKPRQMPIAKLNLPPLIEE